MKRVKAFFDSMKVGEKMIPKNNKITKKPQKVKAKNPPK